MSELKGQLLGVILVITLFGIVSGVLTGVFNAYKRKINSEVTETIGVDPTANNEFANLLTY